MIDRKIDREIDERKRERESVCVCVRERERERKKHKQFTFGDVFSNCRCFPFHMTLTS